MNIIIVKILILISIIIIIFGISAGKSIKDEVKDSGIPTQNIYIDGSDATALTEALLEMGSGLLGIVIIIYSFLGVACIWGSYGIILLIMHGSGIVNFSIIPSPPRNRLIQSRLVQLFFQSVQ